MAGYASQTDYEADLLQTYLRKGRVSPIAKRDVDLALSIYRMPKSKTNYKDLKKLDYASAKKAAKGKSDSTLMRMATVAVLNKSIADRKAAAAAKAAGKKPPATAPSTYRPLAVPPPPPAATPTNSYSGPLTPPRLPTAPKTMAPPAPKPVYKPRTPRVGTYTPR